MERRRRPPVSSWATGVGAHMITASLSVVLLFMLVISGEPQTSATMPATGSAVVAVDADAGGCVSNKERKKLRLKQWKSKVHTITGTTGFFLGWEREGKRIREVRLYPRCGKSPNPKYVEVAYAGNKVYRLDHRLANFSADS